MIIGKEIDALIYLSKLNPSNDEIESVKHTFENSEIQVSIFAALAIEHRVAQIIYINMVRFDLIHYLPVKWRDVMKCVYEFVKKKNIHFLSRLEKVFLEMNSKDITYAVIKGAMLINEIYSDYGLRQFNDIDILVMEKDLSSIEKMLVEQGFSQEIYDIKTRTRVLATKKQKIFHRMTTHELLPFRLKTGISDLGEITVDIQFDIFNRGKFMKQEYNMKSLFNNLETINVNNACITILNPKYNILQLSSHLYHDAVRIRTIRNGRDLELARFLDLYEYINMKKSKVDWVAFSDELNKSNINHIVFYSLYFTELLYGEFLPDGFLKDIMPTNTDYLDTYGLDEGLLIKWEIPFPKRMFLFNRSNVVKNINIDGKSQFNTYHEGINRLSKTSLCRDDSETNN